MKISEFPTLLLEEQNFASLSYSVSQQQNIKLIFDSNLSVHKWFCTWPITMLRECTFYMYMYNIVFIISWKRLTSVRDKESSEKRSRRSGLCINDSPLPSSLRLFVKLFGEGGVMDSLLN